ncbi:MAG: hypothetical protein J6U40_04640 [Kiritimatiellae bacterium]|nr:hypothetical protein [Kiritimatiellia bacterium]
MQFKVMILTAFFVVRVVFLLVAQNIQTNQALWVIAPEYPLFCDEEDIPITVTFTNCLERSVPIVPETEELGVLKGQIAFVYLGTNGLHDLRQPFDKHVTWDKVISFPNLSTLPQGSNCTWNLVGRYIDTYYCAEHSVTSIACRVRVDENHYIQSLPVNVSFSSQEIPISEVIFSGQYQIEGFGSMPINICKTRVLGTNWLFTVGSGMRLCRYKDTETPHFSLDGQLGRLSISFTSSTNTVLFDCHTGQVLPRIPLK